MLISDPFIHPTNIKEDLRDITKLAEELVLKLSLLNQDVRYIFSKIRDCESLDAARGYFDLLEQIECVLAGLVFTNDIGIPVRLRRFISDFDNFEEAKGYYFEKIKSGEYTF
jgi:hypothetical protein